MMGRELWSRILHHIRLEFNPKRMLHLLALYVERVVETPTLDCGLGEGLDNRPLPSQKATDPMNKHLDIIFFSPTPDVV